MPGRYYVALFHNRLARWLKGDVFLGLPAHEFTQHCQGFTLGPACSLQFLLAPRLDLYTIFINATPGIEQLVIAPLFQAVDTLDNPPIQVLLQVEQFFIQAHQLSLARLFIDSRDDIQGKVENTLQVTRREVQQETNTTWRSLKVPDVTDGRSQFNMSHALATYL